MINIRNGMINKDLLELTILLNFKKFFDQDFDAIAQFMLDDNVFGTIKNDELIDDDNLSFVERGDDEKQQKKLVIKRCLQESKMPSASEYNIDPRYQEVPLEHNVPFIEKNIHDNEKFTRLLSAVAMQWAMNEVWKARFDYEETKKYKNIEERLLAWSHYNKEKETNINAKKPEGDEPSFEHIQESSQIAAKYSEYITAGFGKDGKQYIATIGLLSSDNNEGIEEIRKLERINLLACKEDNGHIEYKIQYCNSNGDIEKKPIVDVNVFLLNENSELDNSCRNEKDVTITKRNGEYFINFYNQSKRVTFRLGVVKKNDDGEYFLEYSDGTKKQSLGIPKKDNDIARIEDLQELLTDLKGKLDKIADENYNGKAYKGVHLNNLRAYLNSFAMKKVHGELYSGNQAMLLNKMYKLDQ